ncbi:MAG: glycosyltransferase [Lachnospiraceae bacterium]|nr:glycosyltransferase [Lachnospiraceae bacterium]
MTFDIVIPTYKPDKKLFDIIKRLRSQSVLPGRIILINTGKKYMDELLGDEDPAQLGFEVINISEKDFDHGATRNEGAASSSADLLLFMTMDALPADEKMAENMIKAFDTPKVAAVFARQLPYEDASLGERFSRSFNYPADPYVKSSDDKARLGIKTYFCSNACAMYDRAVFEKLGKFPVNMIFNEDMVFAHTLIENGYSIAYAADATVYHSHNYTNMQQFHRNFDLAVSQAIHPEVFENVSSESEGRSYVKDAFSYFMREKRPLYFIPFAFACAFRLAGYRLGKKYEKLPYRLILCCTASPNYFSKNRSIKDE